MSKLRVVIESPLKGDKGSSIRMHNFILGTKPVDHKDGNGLNNQRNNLRPATSAENSRNLHVVYGAVPFKGVHRHPGLKFKYRARIRSGGKAVHLGLFVTAEEAARAYDAAAIKIFGEFAQTNSTLGLLKD